jgi:hypothetical protein
MIIIIIIINLIVLIILSLQVDHEGERESDIFRSSGTDPLVACFDLISSSVDSYESIDL